MPLVDQPRKGGFSLGDYIEVKERVRLFLEQFPDGRLVTDRVEIWQDDGVPRVVVKALAYRTPDDPLPSVGWSWMLLPGTTSYTRGSEVENTETSAIGRAIGFLGIGIDKSIASKNEIDAKQDDRTASQVAAEEVDQPSDGSLIGTVTEGKPPVDLQLRTEPDGTSYTGFALAQGRKRLQVVAVSPLAEVLQPFLADLVGQRVTCWGTVEMVPWFKDGRAMPEYQRLQLERIQTADWTLPSPRREAPSVGLGLVPITPEEAAAIVEAEKEEATR